MQGAGSPTIDEALGISLDDSNNTYTTGYFTSTAKFGVTSLTSGGISDVFVTKTNSSGIFQWAVKGGDGGSDRGLAIKTDAKGNSYVTGYYFGTAKFDADIITSAGLQDVFIAKYDRNGNLKWLVSGGGTESDIGNAINIDNNGNVLVTGQFTGTAKFGTFTLTSTANNVNVFTAKLDSSNGNFIWAKSGVGPHTDRGLGVACDPTGNVYVTGQFSDTITFGNVHYTTLYDAIFVIKYNSSGTEQWFTTAGGGAFNIASAITVDNSSNVYITGNFTGSLTFFVSPPYTLTNKYPDCVFIAKYNSGGNLLWATADGSTNPVTSNSISLDNSGNAYIIGNFECVFNGYADQYGQGTFNTVGYWDVYTSEYSSAGTWQWSRQIGGHQNNYGNGIAVTPAADVFTAGSFDQDMIITTGVNFIGYRYNDWFHCGWCFNYFYNYCSDPYYWSYALITTSGNLDVFIAKPIDLSRQTYDYYEPEGPGCSRPYEGVCISNNWCDTICPDTVQFCYPRGQLYVITKTLWGLCDYPGPNFTWLWSDRTVGYSDEVTAPGWYSVTQTSADGCFTSKDSVYVIINPLPAQPTISDNVVINTNATNPKPIRICGGAVILTAGNYGSNSYLWRGNAGFIDSSKSITIYASTPDSVFTFTVVDSKGCENETYIIVVVDSALPKIIPKLIGIGDSSDIDTVKIIAGTCFAMFPYDSISNPLGQIWLCIPPSKNTVINWTVTPGTIVYSSPTSCPITFWDGNYFFPADSGWYNITATIVRENICDTNIMSVSDSIYVRILPPFKLTITGKTFVCPGDTSLLVASGAPNYSWSNGSTKDSIWAKPGRYTVQSYVPNKYGCGYFRDTTITVKTDPQPRIKMNPADGLICPGDSVEISSSSSDASFAWQGPLGPIGGDTSSIYVKTEGNYNCVITDSNHCTLLSNTVTVNLYATPYLVATPNSVICSGDSAKLIVIASSGSTVDWQSPLSGSDTVQYVKSSGLYTCKVVSCGITTMASVSVTVSTPKAIIISSGSDTLCNGDSVKLIANSGMTTYVWNPGSIVSTMITVSKAGTYYLTTTDSYGCIAKDSVTITASNLKGTIAASGPETICVGQSVILTANSGMTNYVWNPGGTGTQAITVTKSGTYTVTVTNSYGCTAKDSTMVNVLNPRAIITASGPETFCGGDSVILTANSGMSSYIWNPGNVNGPSITIAKSGTYTLIATDTGGCKAQDTVTITVTPNNVPAPRVADTSVCAGDSVILVASGMANLEWFSNSSGGTPLGAGVTLATPAINGPAIFYVESDTNGCRSPRISVKVDTVDCKGIYIPNVFTPNGDGKDDIWFVTIERAKCFECNIYNRWGVLVYVSNDINAGWDGIIMQTHEKASDGVYYYIINFCNYLGEQEKRDGFIQLIRN